MGSILASLIYLRVISEESIKPRKKSKRMASSRVHVLLASWVLLLVIAPVLVEGEDCDACYVKCQNDGNLKIFCLRCLACKVAEEWKRPMPPDNDPILAASVKAVRSDRAAEAEALAQSKKDQNQKDMI